MQNCFHVDNEDSEQTAQMIIESSLGAHVRRYVSSRCCSIIFMVMLH